MSERPTIPDPEDAVRRSMEAFDRRNWDAAVAFFTHDCTWDSPEGLGVSAGRDAIRSLFQDRRAAFEHFEQELEEFCDLGNGVGFGVNVQKGRPVGSTGVVQLRQGFVSLVEGGLIQRVATYLDPDEARAAAAGLAEERE